LNLPSAISGQIFLDGAGDARLGLGARARKSAGQRQAAHHQAHQVDLDLRGLEEGDLHDTPVKRRSAQVRSI
jgi:hypothetical protein